MPVLACLRLLAVLVGSDPRPTSRRLPGPAPGHGRSLSVGRALRLQTDLKSAPHTRVQWRATVSPFPFFWGAWAASKAICDNKKPQIKKKKKEASRVGGVRLPPGLQYWAPHWFGFWGIVFEFEAGSGFVAR